MNIEAESAIADYESLNSHGNGRTVTVPAHMPLISAVNGLKGILEAVLFVAGEPLTLDRLVTVLEGSSRAEVRDAMSALQTDYAADGRGLQVLEVAGGYQIATRVDCAPWIKRLEKVKAGAKLSRSAMETLAIIAYKQPLVRGEIEQIRGLKDPARSTFDSHCRAQRYPWPADHVWHQQAIPSSVRAQRSVGSSCPPRHQGSGRTGSADSAGNGSGDSVPVCGCDGRAGGSRITGAALIALPLVLVLRR